MKVVIIKYNAGNVLSVEHALKRLGVDALLSSDADTISNADRVIFPGVGEASSTISYLHQHGLAKLIPTLKQPFLGICLGLQLMCKHSAEGDVECLGIFSQSVKRFAPKQKVPHIGWNNLSEMKGPLFAGCSEESYFYFVHSFYAELGDATAAITDYINPFSSVLQRDNFFATQFHPEKSGAEGEKILRNFVELN